MMRATCTLAACVIAVAFAPPSWAADPADATETRALHALFDRQWEDEAARFPEWSTYKGDLRFNDKLSDESAEALADYDAHVRQWLAQARAIRRDRLSHTDQVSLDLKVYGLERHLEKSAHPGLRSLQVGALGGVQTDFAELAKNSPMRTVKQAEDLIARMAAYPRQMDQVIAHMRRGMALGWVSARPVLDRALAQIDEELPADVEQGPFFDPFGKLGNDIAPAEAQRLRAQARAAITQHVVPALRRLRAFIADEYKPRAPASGELRIYPGGAQAYDMLVRHATTTPLTAAQVHAIGQRELARIRAEMEAIMRETKFEGGFEQFVRYLNTDPKFFHTSPEALLAGYRDITKRIDAETPRFFAELPRAPYGVRAMPSFAGPNAMDYYDGPALDGSRGGWFNANALAFRIRPRWIMATLAAHEAVPGHHLQVARAVELKGLPKFRRQGFYAAYVEGWAVYAETLGREIGIYDDPYSRFGHLQWQAFRAARLVVDTGIHSLGWTRERSIDFLVQQTGMDREFMAQEVDRYVSWPGQALSYMIGKLKFDELRDRAKAKLGAKFDIRAFHNAMLDNGAVPLDVLDKLADEWIAQQER